MDTPRDENFFNLKFDLTKGEKKKGLVTCSSREFSGPYDPTASVTQGLKIVSHALENDKTCFGEEEEEAEEEMSLFYPDRLGEKEQRRWTLTEDLRLREAVAKSFLRSIFFVSGSHSTTRSLSCPEILSVKMFIFTNILLLTYRLYRCLVLYIPSLQIFCY